LDFRLVWIHLRFLPHTFDSGTLFGPDSRYGDDSHSPHHCVRYRTFFATTCVRFDSALIRRLLVHVLHLLHVRSFVDYRILLRYRSFSYTTPLVYDYVLRVAFDCVLCTLLLTLVLDFARTRFVPRFTVRSHTAHRTFRSAPHGLPRGYAFTATQFLPPGSVFAGLRFTRVPRSRVDYRSRSTHLCTFSRSFTQFPVRLFTGHCRTVPFYTRILRCLP